MVCGIIWFIGAFILILVGYIGVFIGEGFGGLVRLLNPFNSANTIMVILVLVPGVVLMSLAKKLNKS